VLEIIEVSRMRERIIIILKYDVYLLSYSTKYSQASVSDGDMSYDIENSMSVLICHFQASYKAMLVMYMLVT